MDKLSKQVKAILGILLFVAAMVAIIFVYNLFLDRVYIPENIAESQSDMQLAPDFTMEDEQGNQVRLSDFRGKPVVLNFWASWCPSCVIETPYFDALYQEMGDEIQILKVNLIGSNGETRSHVGAFMDDGGYSFPVFFDTLQEGSMFYSVRFLPMTFFINSDGYLIAHARGAVDDTILQAGLDLIIF